VADTRKTRPRRRGLPRISGGQPWPYPRADLAQVGDATQSASQNGIRTRLSPAETPAFSAGIRATRRGLPRVPGGDPWPRTSTPVDRRATRTAAIETVQTPAQVLPGTTSPHPGAVVVDGAATAELARGAHITQFDDGAILQRRGLPRTAGGDLWPPPRAVPIAPDIATEGLAETAPSIQPITATATEVAPAPRDQGHRDVTAGRRPERRRYRGRTLPQWARLGSIGGGSLLVLGVVSVFSVRWLLGTEPLGHFLTDYPGEYRLPDWAPIGIPWWLNWAHFFNVFLMVLIIRSGLQIRTEKRPTAFWSPRWEPSRKISLTIWFHQSLDLLWLVNGVVFIIVLFATGQWVRIVPTSWEVFPNALSAGLQYISLNWPTENGWVNYNSLQQLTYFSTVFLAAPLAVVTGIRMSGLWPSNAPRLNRIYRIELARAIHFPVMLYFVVFIIFHVSLVLATGALRNLNHMYGGQDVVNWTGFWIFFTSLLVISGSLFAARPIVLAPIASLFGRVRR
jgi:thiosulfate reductase cytochrome b subunit